MSIKAHELFDLKHCPVASGFTSNDYPWEIISQIGTLLFAYVQNHKEEYTEIAPQVWIGKGTTIASNATIIGPALIGHDCEIRPGAYIRENVICGNQVVIGNSTEIKNAILFDQVQVPHFNYVGDSVLGYGAHLGAGVILSNFKTTKETVKVTLPDGRIDTGLRKFGALIGDHVEVGCNTVLNPGTIIGRESIIYPVCSVRGVIPTRTIVKNDGVTKERRS